MKYTSYKKQSLLEKIDKFGVGVSIRYNKQRFHKTSCGGFITLGIWSFIIYNAVIILKQLINHTDPIVIQQIVYKQFQPPLTLHPKKFTLALGLQDINFVHFMDERIYTIRAQETLQIRKETADGNIDFIRTSRPINMVQCNKSHFQVEGSESFFLQLPLSRMYCIDLGQEYPIIEGEFSNTRFSQLEIYFNRCIPSQTKECASPEEINDKLRITTLGSYISDYEINITDENKPFMPNGRNLFWMTGNGMEKDIWLSLITSKLHSDSGRIFEQVQTTENLVYSSNREIVLPTTSSQIFSLNILYEKNKEISYQRNYIKINSAFSQVGGLFNFLFALGYAICIPFSQLSLNKKLINEIFSFQPKENVKENNKTQQGGGVGAVGNVKSMTKMDKSTKYQRSQTGKGSIDERSLQNQTQTQNYNRDGNIDDYDGKSPISPPNNNILIVQTPDFTQGRIIRNIQRNGTIQSEYLKKQRKSNGKSDYNQNNTNTTFNNYAQHNPSPSNTNNNNNTPTNNQPAIQTNGSAAGASNQNLFEQERQSRNQIPAIQRDKSKKLTTHTIQSEMKSQNHIPQEDKRFRMRFCEYFFNYIRIFKCLKRSKYSTIKYGTESILRHIDLFNIIRKFIELEKLKRLLLTDNQRKLFEYLPKPYLNLNKDCESEEEFLHQQKEMKEIIGLFCEDYNGNNKIQEVEIAYQNIKYEQDNLSRLDEKLISMLDKQIRDKIDLQQSQICFFNKNNNNNNNIQGLLSPMNSVPLLLDFEKKMNEKIDNKCFQQQMLVSPSKFKRISFIQKEEFQNKNETIQMEEENDNSNSQSYKENESCMANSCNQDSEFQNIDKINCPIFSNDNLNKSNIPINQIINSHVVLNFIQQQNNNNNFVSNNNNNVINNNNNNQVKFNPNSAMNIPQSLQFLNPNQQSPKNRILTMNKQNSQVSVIDDISLNPINIQQICNNNNYSNVNNSNYYHENLYSFNQYNNKQQSINQNILSNNDNNNIKNNNDTNEINDMTSKKINIEE